MLKWVHVEMVRSGFGIITWRYDFSYDRRQVFYAMRYERSGKYKESIQKFIHDDIET